MTTQKITEKLNVIDAIKKLKATPNRKFDESIELHINTNLDVTKSDQILRASLSLPKGTGKEVKVAVFASEKVPEADVEMTDDILEDIASGKIDPKKEYDVIVAEPKFMPKLSKAARILGPAGLMPNPKTGTVTDEPAKTVAELKKGMVEIRNEPNAPLIHTMIGKKSFSEADLVDNFNAVWSFLKSNKPQKAKPNWIQGIFVSSSMGPGVEIDLETLGYKY